MAIYRDPDDRPVDPDADDERTIATASGSRALWLQADPDGDRPARFGDQDELDLDPADAVIDRHESTPGALP